MAPRLDVPVAVGADVDELLPVLHVASRDNARTPMQWDSSPAAGFTTGTPWIGVNPNRVDINGAAAVDDPDSVFHHYRTLIAMRRHDPVVAHGDYRLLLPDDERVYAFTRSLGEVTLLVACNFSSDDTVAEVPDAASWSEAEVVSSNVDGTVTGDGRGLSLRPWEALVLRMEPAPIP